MSVALDNSLLVDEINRLKEQVNQLQIENEKLTTQIATDGTAISELHYRCSNLARKLHSAECLRIADEQTIRSQQVVMKRVINQLAASLKAVVLHADSDLSDLYKEDI